MKELRYHVVWKTTIHYWYHVDRLGSLWADYEIIGTKTQLNKNKFEAGVASSMSKILKGEHTFNILKQETRVIAVTMKDNNGSTTMSEQSKFYPTVIILK